MVQQLSKQDHYDYDYGLRHLKAVLHIWRETTLRWQRRLFWWGWVIDLTFHFSVWPNLTWHDIIEIHFFSRHWEIWTYQSSSRIDDERRASSVCSSGTSFPAWDYLPVYVGIRWRSPSRRNQFVVCIQRHSSVRNNREFCNKNSSFPRSFSSLTHVLPVTVICS